MLMVSTWFNVFLAYSKDASYNLCLSYNFQEFGSSEDLDELYGMVYIPSTDPPRRAYSVSWDFLGNPM